MIMDRYLTSWLDGKIPQPVFWISVAVIAKFGKPPDRGPLDLSHFTLEREFVDLDLFAILEIIHFHGIPFLLSDGCEPQVSQFL